MRWEVQRRKGHFRPRLTLERTGYSGDGWQWVVWFLGEGEHLGEGFDGPGGDGRCTCGADALSAKIDTLLAELGAGEVLDA